MSFSVAEIRKDFPIFERTVRDGKRLVYLDSGATSQKPLSVIEAESNFYKYHNAAVHRGAHQLAEEAYAMGNATTGNRFALTPEDQIVVTQMEHHSNLIPWQQLSARTGAKLSWFGVTFDGRLDLSSINDVITANTKVVSLTHQSNVLGTINPLEAIVARAHDVGAVVILDACQSAPHMKLDIKSLGVDFLVFSGHKTLGPTGVGVLWGDINLLNELPPFLFGGSMIETVEMTSATWAPVPQKFEAGVPNMAQAVHAHEIALTQYLLEKMSAIPDLRIVGPANTESRGGTVSFTVKDIHPHDIGQYVDSQGVAVRTGHHCAWPLAKRMNVTATTRASLYLYNDESDCDALVDSIIGAQKYFGKF